MKKVVFLVALAAILVFPGAVIAGSNTDSTSLTVRVLPASIDIEAPDAIDTWNLLVGQNSRTATLHVTCNANWNVAVKDVEVGKPAGSQGYLVEWDGMDYGAVVLDNALGVQAAGQSEVTLSGSEQYLWDLAQGPADQDYTITFNQSLGAMESDALGKTVHTVVTFVGTTY